MGGNYELDLRSIRECCGFMDWVFINSPRRARGAGDPNVPFDMEVFEWYGEEGGSYEKGWLHVNSEGLEETLPTIKALSPNGVVGFSQGGAMASLVECDWVALFSPVVAPNMQSRDTSSFHVYDPAEEYVSQCIQVQSHFSKKTVHTHNEGHAIPQNKKIVRAFAEWAA